MGGGKNTHNFDHVVYECPLMEFTPPQLINFRLIICSLKKCASNANKKPTLMMMMMSSTNQQPPPIPAPRTPKAVVLNLLFHITPFLKIFGHKFPKNSKLSPKNNKID